MKYILLALLASAMLCLPVSSIHAQPDRQALLLSIDSINSYLSGKAAVTAAVKLDTFRFNGNRLDIHLNSAIADYPLRDKDIKTLKDIIRLSLPDNGKEISVNIYTNKAPLEKFSSSFYSGREYSYAHNKRHNRWIESDDKSFITEGLDGRNIALWAGHGYYYCNEEDRWKWQRAPFFSTIEDLLTQSYVTGFLAPMLENAGACVLIPRERDTQTNEIIVDNGDSFYSELAGKDGGWEDSKAPGFAHRKKTYISGENPFKDGTARIARSQTGATASYRPFFPETGDYAVYISYQTLDKSTYAEYTVRYSGGERRFTVDQRSGGGTWVYLGTFRFTEGETSQGVTVGSSDESNGIITTDAVRFGGGKGNISREGMTSGYPRYAEAATYWLQWSGFPEKVYSLNDCKNDYKDDYMSRGEWVNSMKNDFGIPIDMALALHTDAGSALSDSIIGTLAIYREMSENKTSYSDGRQRIIARELADIIQTSIVDDIRAAYRHDWTRRGLRDRSYIEARVPDVPTALLELLSHQNFPDMQYALDPKFKFTVSRAIYKGILKYLSFASGEPYTVQPLPVKDFSAVLTGENRDGASVVLSWTPVQDSLEPTAKPESYIVYRRVIDPHADPDTMPGFDNGRKTDGTEFTDRIEPGKLYSYKVVAINKGGASFPSEILSAGYMPGSKKILVVNGFTSTSSPTPFDRCDSLFAGFNFKAGYGIPYIKDIDFIGEQYEFDRSRRWIHDDRPGFGSSYLDYGPAPVAGNTFDYPSVHGLSIMRCGLSFCSVSMNGFLKMTPSENTGIYAIDLIFGKEKSYPHIERLYEVLDGYCNGGTSIIVSGSYIGKSSDYDYDRQYPENVMLGETADRLNEAVAKLETLKASEIWTSPELPAKIDSMANSIRSLISGMGKDLDKSISDYRRSTDDSFTMYRLASEIFKFQWSNGSASTSGKVHTVRNRYGIFEDTAYTASFPTRPNPDIYCVESPDAILPSDSDACTFMRYDTGNTSAAVAYSGAYKCVSFGFPLETITSQHQMDLLMREVMDFLVSED